MRITFLVDNLPHPTLPLLTEHGLSMYIDQITPNSSLLTPNSILCDMGASGAYIKNAKALGIDLDTCHWAFLSHGHADHTGGLGKWVAQYGHIPVYASHHIPTLQCFSSRPKKVASLKSQVESQRFDDSAIQHSRSEIDSPTHQITASPSRSELRSISPDLNLFCGHTPWFKPIEQNTWISPGIALVHPTCNLYPKPLGNKYLTVVEGQCELTDESFNRLIDKSYNCLIEEPSTIQRERSEQINDSAIQREQSEIDPFDHEIALCFVTPKGLVIVSCCSHHGALNTIASCMEFTGCNTLHAYIGGLHFVDSPEVEAETTSFISDWLTLYPNAHLYTGHCTCPKAAALLKAHLPKCHTFYTGNVIEV